MAMPENFCLILQLYVAQNFLEGLDMLSRRA